MEVPRAMEASSRGAGRKRERTLVVFFFSSLLRLAFALQTLPQGRRARLEGARGPIWFHLCELYFSALQPLTSRVDQAIPTKCRYCAVLRLEEDKA